MTTPNLQETIARAKGEILADVRSGHVPAGVRNFTALHDYVEANEYGGLFENWPADWDIERDPFITFWNAIQDTLDDWITSGAMRQEAGWSCPDCDTLNGHQEDCCHECGRIKALC